MLTQEMVSQWEKEPNYLRRGDFGDDVEILQRLYNKVGIKCGIDGDFGPETERCTEDFQERRITLADSIVGPMTKAELVYAYRGGWIKDKVPWLHKSGVMVYGPHHPELGEIPAAYGKTSCYGGPTDWGDLMYGQSMIVDKFPNQLKKAKDVYEKYPELVEMGIFRKDIEKLPIVKRPKTGKEYQAGVSWMLNPDSFFFAMRWSYRQREIISKAPQKYLMLFGIPSKDRWCIGAPLDYGPAKWTNRNSDLSHGFENELVGGKSITDRWVVHGFVAMDVPRIGPV